jgi:hypothetical protein
MLWLPWFQFRPDAARKLCVVPGHRDDPAVDWHFRHRV